MVGDLRDHLRGNLYGWPKIRRFHQASGVHRESTQCVQRACRGLAGLIGARPQPPDRVTAARICSISELDACQIRADELLEGQLDGCTEAVDNCSADTEPAAIAGCSALFIACGTRARSQHSRAQLTCERTHGCPSGLACSGDTCCQSGVGRLQRPLLHFGPHARCAIAPAAACPSAPPMNAHSAMGLGTASVIVDRTSGAHRWNLSAPSNAARHVIPRPGEVCGGDQVCASTCQSCEACIGGACVSTCEPGGPLLCCRVRRAGSVAVPMHARPASMAVVCRPAMGVYVCCAGDCCDFNQCQVCIGEACVSSRFSGEACNGGGVCDSETCADGIENGSETDVDCGGPDCPQCTEDQRCLVDDDCATGLRSKCFHVPVPL